MRKVLGTALTVISVLACAVLVAVLAGPADAAHTRVRCHTARGGAGVCWNQVQTPVRHPVPAPTVDHTDWPGGPDDVTGGIPSS